jgi:hypothetical protein
MHTDWYAEIVKKIQHWSVTVKLKQQLAVCRIEKVQDCGGTQNFSQLHLRQVHALTIKKKLLESITD